MSDRVWTIAKREFRSYFDHATAYVILVVFLATNFFFFFRNLFMGGVGSLRPMFDLLPWLFLFFVPAITMGTIAEERSTGSLELTLAQPLREAEFLLGKYLGVMGLVAVALLATLGAPLGLTLGTDVRWGVVFAQYVGAFLLAGGLVAIGLWASTMTENQITAFILGVAVIFVFVGMNLNVVRMGLPPVLATVADRLGVLTHFRNVTRGVLDLRDVVYFLTLAAGFLSLAYWSLLREQLSREGSAYRALRLGTAGLLGIFVVVNLLGRHIRGRWDLTPGNAYTISDATRETLTGLDDVVTVKFFVSEELPAQVSHVKRDVVDLLRDYESIAGDDFRLQRIDPGSGESARQQARQAGIPPIQFNVLGQGQMQVQQGWMGISLQYADDSQQIPVIRESANLEYRLTSAIHALTAESKPTVGFLTGHGEKSLRRDLGRARKSLSRAYQVQPVSFGGGRPGMRRRMPPGMRRRMPPGAPMGGGRGGPAPSARGGPDQQGVPSGLQQAGPDTAAGDTASGPARVPSGVDALVVAGPQNPLPGGHVEALRRFLEGGGNLFLMLEGMRQPKGPRGPAMPMPPSPMDSLLAEIGVSVVSGYALDMRANQRVGLSGQGGMRYSRPYPLWLMARPASGSRLVRDLSAVMLPWASPVEVAPSADTAAVQPLLETTQYGGRVTGTTSVRPQRNWKAATDSLRRQTLAVAVNPDSVGGEGTAAADSTGPGRLVLVGDSDFATNRFARGGGNLDFFRNAVDWLAREEALIEIRGGDRSPPRLVFESSVTRSAVRWANLAGVPLLFVLIGGWRLWRRRRVQRRSWEPGGDR
ncbi:MAG: Gldg family protein [Gemmatimonadota bacterium]